MQKFDGNNNHSMKKMIDQRIRFYPSLSGAISGADEMYERVHVTEAQLKALSIAASGGTQWACGSCGEHRKAEAVLAANLGVSEADVRARLTYRGETGGRRLLKVRYLANRTELVNTAIESGIIAGSDRFWACLAVGLWSVPLMYPFSLGKGVYTSEAERIKLIQNEALQAVHVAQFVDSLPSSRIKQFGEICKQFAEYIDYDKPDVFSFQAVGIYNRLIESGHTAEI